MTDSMGPVLLPEPFFLEGGQGRVFATYFPPRGSLKGAMLYLPPFAEEMNRCRVAVADQARQFAELGYATLLLDLFGTGDSEGDFSEVSWQRWLQDADLAARWLEDRSGAAVGLWGFRLGALLGADAARLHPGRFNYLLMWQPVLDGKLFFTQYLRLRVAYLMDRGLPAETTESMRQRLQAGGTVEVAGYLLSGCIAADLDAKRLADMTDLRGLEIGWFEHVSEAGKALSAPGQKAIEHLRGQSCTVDAQTYVGAPIWQLHDRDQVPQLVELTTELFRGRP
jgi:exosortase A-associated hydrolase 2